MKRFVPLLLSLVLSAGAGCGRKQPEISSLQRKQAAALATEAEFASSIRDYARAEDLLRQATTLCPDNGAYWLNLGTLCRKADHKSDARQAYTSAADAFAADYKANPKDPAPLMRQMYVYALLGRADDAKAVLKKARKEHPADESVASFDDAAIDRMMADPTFKALAI